MPAYGNKMQQSRKMADIIKTILKGRGNSMCSNEGTCASAISANRLLRLYILENILDT